MVTVEFFDLVAGGGPLLFSVDASYVTVEETRVLADGKVVANRTPDHVWLVPSPRPPLSKMYDRPHDGYRKVRIKVGQE